MENNNEKESLTREYIFESFYKLLQTKHYNDISVCDITQKAGVSRMSFYRNFKSKEDLTFKSIEKITKNVQDQIMSLEIKDRHIISKTLFEIFKEYKNIINAFENAEILDTLIPLTMKKLKETFPYDNINKTARYVPVYYFGAIASVIREWLKNDCEESPEEMARLFDVLINDDDDFYSKN